MPLIILAGLPLSGKSTVAQQLQAFFTEEGLFPADQVHWVHDGSLRVSPSLAYSSPHEEKKARAALLSAVERLLHKESLVICDGLNYIKGFRYQLYCVARALSTPTCVVYTACPVQVCSTRFTALRAQSPAQDTYPEDQFENLCSRFEEPDDRRNRWDSPLFLLSQHDQVVPLFGSRLIDTLVHRQGPPPNLSTVNTPLAQANYLTEWDSLVQEGLDLIAQAQREGFSGGKLKWPKSAQPLDLPSRKIPLPELRRLKRQYLTLSKSQNKRLTLTQVADALVDYLNIQLK